MVDILASLVTAGFYALLLAAGLIAGMQARGKNVDSLMLAGRQLSLVPAVLSLVATFFGIYILLDCTEGVYRRGLLWTMSPIAVCITFLLLGALVAGRVRDEQYVTLLDVIQAKFGMPSVVVLFIVCATADVCCAAVALRAVGDVLAILTGVDSVVHIVVLTVVVTVYTVFGALYSVAYTDAVRLLLIFGGLVTCAALFAQQTEQVEVTQRQIWLGEREGMLTADTLYWVEEVLLLILAGVPMQMYVQRACATVDGRSARLLFILAIPFVLLAAAPLIMIGIYARTAEWGGKYGIDRYYPNMLLAIVYHEKMPFTIACIGTGVFISAAQSTLASCLLSSATLFTHNLWRRARQRVTDHELVWVLRISMIVLAQLIAVIACILSNTYGFMFFAIDLLYMVALPQLVAALFIPFANVVGSFVGMTTALAFRLTAGDHLTNLPTLIEWPLYAGSQRFPYRAVGVVASLAVTIVVSAASNEGLRRRRLAQQQQQLDAAPQPKPEQVRLVEKRHL